MSVRRAPLLRRYEDPATSSDPRVRELVGQLATLPVAPPLRAEFRADLRAQLVAITPRIVAEMTAETQAKASAEDARAENRSFAARLRAMPIGRPLMVAASVVTVLALIFGGAVWLSQKSVPGDALYGLKRASEKFELSVADNDTERAQDHLEFAQRRVEEAKTLLGRTSASGVGPQADGVSAEKAKLIATALGSSNTDVLTAWNLLKNQSDRTHSGRHLDTMTNWAPDQLQRLQALETATPDGALRAQVVKSRNLVTLALTLSTAEAKKYASGSGARTGGATSTPGPQGPGAGTATSGPSSRPGTGGGTSAKNGTRTTTPGGVGPATASTTPGGILPSPPAILPSTVLPTTLPKLPITLPKLPITLPKLPTTLPKLPNKAPIKVNQSCVSASVVIGVHLGDCSGH